MQAAEISQSAMDVEWKRLEVIAANIANANTARTANGEPYRALRLMSGPAGGFQRLLADGSMDPASLGGVSVYGLAPINLPPRVVYEPGNPQADAKGYVTYPGIDQAQEMTLMVKTARVYEANVLVMNIGRQMYAKAMEIGR